MTATSQPAAFPRQIISGTGANGNTPTFIVSAEVDSTFQRCWKPSIPPVTFALWLEGAHIQTYLTADEARLLGATLLDAAAAVQLEPAEGQGAA